MGKGLTYLISYKGLKISSFLWCQVAASGKWFFYVKRYFQTGLPASWLFPWQRKGHSKIYGTVIFGFTKTGVWKQTQLTSVQHSPESIFKFSMSVVGSFELCKHLHSNFVRQQINTNCVIA